MSDFVFRPIKPHQHDFIYSDKRYILNSGGVGSGKTYSIVLRTLRLMINNPGIFCLLGAQTFPLLRNTTLREFINLVPQKIIASYNKSNHHVKFLNGSELIFVSFDDPNKLKSLNLGACGIEEMTDISEDIFKMLRTRMRQDKMPGCIYGATNPGSFDNWVYKFFIEKKQDQIEVVYSISSDNKYLPEEYLKDLSSIRDTNPEYYERMVMGKWGLMEGTIYNLGVRQRLNDVYHKSKYNRIIAGVDFGFSSPTALTVVGIRDNKYYIIDEIYQYKMTSSDIANICKEKMNEYDIDVFYCDSSRPEIIDDLNRSGVPAQSSIKDIFDGIMCIKSLIGENRFFVYDQCTHTLREFDSYIWDKKNTLKEIPLKVNDHCMDSIRYAIYTDIKKLGQEIVLDKFDTMCDRVTAQMDF